MEWRNVDYNLGNFFDGTYFTAPENGLYSFNVLCKQQSSSYGYISLSLNDQEHAYAVREESDNRRGFVNINTTLKLVKNDKVHARFYGNLYATNSEKTTFFEGRRIARLEE